MASLQQKGVGWYCQFLYGKKRHTFAVGQVSKDEAEAKASQVDYLLMRLGQGLLTLPAGMDVVTFVRYDGRPPSTPASAPVQKTTSLEGLRDRYLETHSKA